MIVVSKSVCVRVGIRVVAVRMRRNALTGMRVWWPELNRTSRKLDNATSNMLLSWTTDTSFVWQWAIDTCDYNGLTNTARGVLIGNKSSSQIGSATMWTLTIDVYLQNVTDLKALSRNVFFMVMAEEGLMLYCFGCYFISCVSPTY